MESPLSMRVTDMVIEGCPGWQAVAPALPGAPSFIGRSGARRRPLARHFPSRYGSDQPVSRRPRPSTIRTHRRTPRRAPLQMGDRGGRG